jgi:hypothetical protein
MFIRIIVSWTARKIDKISLATKKTKLQVSISWGQQHAHTNDMELALQVVQQANANPFLTDSKSSKHS